MLLVGLGKKSWKIEVPGEQERKKIILQRRRRKKGTLKVGWRGGGNNMKKKTMDFSAFPVTEKRRSTVQVGLSKSTGFF